MFFELRVEWLDIQHTIWNALHTDVRTFEYMNLCLYLHDISISLFVWFYLSIWSTIYWLFHQVLLCLSLSLTLFYFYPDTYVHYFYNLNHTLWLFNIAMV